MITLLFYIINIIKILSYIPTEFTISPLNYSPYLRDTCTCDLTYNVCDRNCGCDPFCDFSKYGFFDDFFEEYVESNVILPESVNSVPICSAEHYVIGDLYNPLSVGYQILKKGMCLKKKDQEFDIIENPDKIKDIISTEQIDSENMKKFFLQTPVSNSFNDNYQNIEYFVFPVMAPSGMCMEGYPIKPGEDKTVICSIQGKNISDFNQKVRKYINTSVTNFAINDYEIMNYNGSGIIKKVEINIYISEGNEKNICLNTSDNDKCFYYLYYKNENLTSNIISDVTFVVKFFVFNSSPIPKKSGNPGYLIGSPIRFGKKDGENINPFYRNRLFIGSFSDGNCIIENQNESKNYFEDLILSNSITFENRTLFTCYRNSSSILPQQTLIISLINRYITTYYISQFGNSINSTINLNDYLATISQCINEDNNNNNNEVNQNYIIIKILYQFDGVKLNPQRKIINVKCDLHSIDNDQAIYIEFLFIHQNNEVKKKEVPRPKIIKLPHNWLYPFRFGTTDYEDKD